MRAWDEKLSLRLATPGNGTIQLHKGSNLREPPGATLTNNLDATLCSSKENRGNGDPQDTGTRRKAVPQYRFAQGIQREDAEW